MPRRMAAFVLMAFRIGTFYVHPELALVSDHRLIHHLHLLGCGCTDRRAGSELVSYFIGSSPNRTELIPRPGGIQVNY
jgi:hypothetical protein